MYVGNEHRREAFAMNTMGCSLLVLGAAAFLVGFIPILGWINLVVVLPLALLGTISAGRAARKPEAQPADTTVFWIAVGLLLVVILRLIAS